MEGVVKALLASALRTALERACRPQVAAAILDALKLVRAAVDERNGFAAASQLDAGVRDLVLARTICHWSGLDGVPEAQPLPIGLPRSAIANAVIEDAVQSCLSLDAHSEHGVLLDITVTILSEALVLSLDGPAALADVIGYIRCHADAPRALSQPYAARASVH
ncbi:MAG: hypothetical protein JOY66_13725 [Acetobacteraceae bacterium]|nr:hypothetical protein [Acetobacteraceae bacterium]